MFVRHACQAELHTNYNVPERQTYHRPPATCAGHPETWLGHPCASSIDRDPAHRLGETRRSRSVPSTSMMSRDDKPQHGPKARGSLPQGDAQACDTR